MPPTAFSAQPRPQSSWHLFTALWPDASLQQALAAARDGLNLPAACRPVATHRLHMVLHSLGHCADLQLPDVKRRLPPIRRGFEMRMAQLERWPGGELVLRPDHEPPEMGALFDQQAQALRQQGLSVPEQAFRPHLLLARDCRSSFRLKPVDLRWRVSSYCLVGAGSDGSLDVLQHYSWG